MCSFPPHLFPSSLSCFSHFLENCKSSTNIWCFILRHSWTFVVRWNYEKEANKCNNGLSRSLQPLPVLNCATISQQVENIHKQFNSKISGMNEELCALQLVRLKTIKYKWDFNIFTLKEMISISGNLKIMYSVIIVPGLLQPCKIKKTGLNNIID